MRNMIMSMTGSREEVMILKQMIIIIIIDW